MACPRRKAVSAQPMHEDDAVECQTVQKIDGHLDVLDRSLWRIMQRLREPLLVGCHFFGDWQLVMPSICCQKGQGLSIH